MTAARPGRSVETDIIALDGTARISTQDRLAGEEPLELRLGASGETRALAITMRTPGNDFELAAGFALGEGIVATRQDIREIGYCLDPAIQPDQRYNVVTIELARATLPDTAAFERHFTTSSACGVCGRAQLQALGERAAPIVDDISISRAILFDLPDRMRAAQKVFAATGGLHAAALFDSSGNTVAVREDVGRHNAVDKLVGWALLAGRSLAHSVLMVSGRASYEIVQKAVVARIPIVCAVSAPSSLAVALAREFGITLCGFVRGARANVYSCAERIG